MSETPNTPEMPETSGPSGDGMVGEIFAGERITGRKMDGADLGGADMTRIQLKRSSFVGAVLQDASFCGAQLTHVNLSRANLRGADLRGAHLSNVDLSEADLTGADLLGAVLKGVNLDRATLVECKLAGADLETVSLTATDLSRADLDGATCESNTFKQTRLEGTTLRGSRLGRCTVEDCTLEGCDLSGAMLDTSLLKETRWSDCDLYGTLFRKVRFRTIEVATCDATHSHFEDCTGLPPDAEMELAEAGALMRPNVGAKIWRELRQNRKLQLGVLVTVALVLVAAILVVSLPTLWPTWALVSRMESLSNNADETNWCDDYVEFGEILAERSMENVSRQNQLLFVAAHCYGDNEKHDDAERLFRRGIELASGSTRDLHTARLQLASYFVTTDRLEEAEGIAREIADDPRADAWTRLNGLRQVEGILSQRGGAGTAPTEWVELQVRIAEEILANDYETHTAGMLMETPAELYVWGKWDLADRLLAWAVPPLSDADCWTQVAKAMDRAAQLGRGKEAVALCEHLLQSERFADGLYRALLVHQEASLLAKQDAQDEIEALFERLDPTADAELDLVEAILSIRRNLDEDEPAKALAGATALTLDDLPLPLLELAVWAQVDASLAANKEDVAIESLRPLMAAIEDQDSIDRATTDLVELSGRLQRPDLLADMVASVGNPVLGEFNVLREILLTTLQQEADDGTLAVDDPRLTELLNSPDEWVSERAMQMLMSAAEASGEQSEALDLLAQRARQASGTSRLSIGLAVMEGHINRGDAAAAIAIAEDLKLAESATGDYRARVFTMLVLASLRDDDSAAAEAWLQRALEAEPPLLPDRKSEIIRQMVQHHIDHGSNTKALELLRRHEILVDLSDHEEALLGDYLYLLYATDQDSVAEAHLAAIAADTPPCAVEYNRLAALARAEKSGGRMEGLVKACNSPDADDDLKLQVATYIDGSEADVDILPLVQGIKKDRMSVWDRTTVSILEAGCVFDDGEPDAAIALLETEYAQLVDGDARGAITATLLTYYEEQEEPEELQRVYARFATDHTADLGQEQWQQASQALMRMGEGDRIATLASKAEWNDTMQLTLAKLELGQLVEAGKYTEAWSFLDKQREGIRDPRDLEQLVWWSREVREASGDSPSYATLLEAIEKALPAGSPIAIQVQLDRADAASSMGDHEKSLALLTPMLSSDLAPETRADTVRLYARSLGYSTAKAATVEAGLKKLEGLKLQPALRQEARLEAAGGLVERSHYKSAQEVLAPLAGAPLTQSASSAYYHVIVRAWTEAGMFDDAVGLATRFPPGPSLGACQVDLMLVGAVPPDSAAFETLHARILANCKLESMPPAEFMSLVDSTSQSQPDRALSMIEQYRETRKLSDGEGHSIDVGEARLLQQKGDHAASRAILIRVIENGTDTWVVTSALGSLLQGANSEQALMPQAEAEAAVTKALALVETGSDEAIQIQRDVVQYHIGAGRKGEALKRQRILVESLTGTGPVEAEELLQLAKLEITAEGYGSRSWRRHADAAMKMAGGDEQLRLRIESLLTAAKVAASPLSRAVAIVSEASKNVPEPQRGDFASWVADELEQTLLEAERAQVLREPEALPE